MNTETRKEMPSVDPPASASALETAKPVTDTVKETAHHATDPAQDACHTMASKAGDTVALSREYARWHLVPVLLGALALGAAVACMIGKARRKEPTLRERFVYDPLTIARDAVYAALAPVSQRLHEGYDSARNGASKAVEKLQGIHPSHSAHSWANQIGRSANKLRFW